MSTEEIFNYRKVNDQIITGGQPTEDQIRAAAAEGFQIVINITTFSPGRSLDDEAGLVQSLGMTYHFLPVVWDDPKESDFTAFEEAMGQIGEKKTLIHCMANFRVSAFYSLYAIKRLGWSEQQAVDFRKSIWDGSDYPIWDQFIATMTKKVLGKAE